MGIVRSVKSWVGEHLIVKELLNDNELKQTRLDTVSYTHLRAHETVLYLVCRLLLEKKTTICPPFSYTHLRPTSTTAPLLFHLILKHHTDKYHKLHQ